MNDRPQTRGLLRRHPAHPTLEDGELSRVVRIRGSTEDVIRFERLTATERGEILRAWYSLADAGAT